MAVLTINRGTKAHHFGLVMDAVVIGADPSVVYSDVWEVYEINGFIIQTTTTGADLEATWVLQCSNAEGGAGRFDDVAEIPFTAIVADPGGESVDVGNARARYYRLKGTRTAGSGTMSADVHAKAGSV